MDEEEITSIISQTLTFFCIIRNFGVILQPQRPNPTFYESFEAYNTSLGLDWIPEGWTEIILNYIDGKKRSADKSSADL